MDLSLYIQDLLQTTPSHAINTLTLLPVGKKGLVRSHGDVTVLLAFQ
jgi:hypothetical protein